MRALQRLVSSAALVIVVGAMAPEASATEYQCGLMNATGIATMPGTETSSSQSYAQVAAYNLTFSQNCVHVQFTAQFRSKTPKAIRVRVTVDGAAAGFPNFVALNTSGGGFDERAMTFFIPTLNGNQAIGIEFRSEDGTPVNVKNGLLRVQYVHF